MSDANIIYRCTERYGTLPPVHVHYWLSERSDGCYVECEFSTLGPMERTEAEVFIARHG
jgi:hypothetical protein